MMAKKITPLLALAGILVISQTFPAYAAETEANTEDTTEVQSTEDTEASEDDLNSLEIDSEEISGISTEGTDVASILGSISSEDLLDSIKSSIEETGFFSSNNLLENSGLSEISTDSLHDLSTTSGLGTLDMSTLNLEYESLIDSMNESFNSVDLSGYSAGCMSLFEGTYGDILDSISYTEYEIPSDFSTSSMLSDASSQISSLYSSATSSDTFSSIKDSVSIREIFSIASDGASSYSLASDAKLSSLTSSLSEQNKYTASSKYKYGSDNVTDFAESYDYVNSVQTAFSNNVDLSNSLVDVDIDDDGNVSVDTNYDNVEDTVSESRSHQGLSKVLNNIVDTSDTDTSRSGGGKSSSDNSDNDLNSSMLNSLNKDAVEEYYGN